MKEDNLALDAGLKADPSIRCSEGYPPSTRSCKDRDIPREGGGKGPDSLFPRIGAGSHWNRWQTLSSGTSEALTSSWFGQSRPEFGQLRQKLVEFTPTSQRVHWNSPESTED